MKTVAASKTTSATSTCTDKSYSPFSTSANRQLSSSKPSKCLKTESEPTWIPLSSSTPADLTLPPQASITSSTITNLAMIHSATIQADKWPEPQPKGHTFIIQTFHTTAMSGTSTHPWNMKTKSIPKISRNNELPDIIRYQYLTYCFFFFNQTSFLVN